MQFTTTAQAAQLNGVKVLLYGPAGVGKTMLCATAPAPLIISAESGLLSLRPQNITRVFGPSQPTISYDIPVVPIRTVEDLTTVYAWLTSSPEAAQFQTICLDSISEIAEVVLSNAKKVVKDPRQAYGELVDKMEMVVRSFRDLPGRNVYVTAKQEPTKDELTGAVRYGPSTPGAKLATKLPYFFDEVLRLGVFRTTQGESYRAVQTQPDLQYEAKDRSGALAPLEKPDLTYIFSKIQGA